MTDEQSKAFADIHQLARENDLLITAIWSPHDVLWYFNRDEQDQPVEIIDYEQARTILFDRSRKEIVSRAVESGWQVIELADANFD